jgi:hypothetical protein
LRQLAGRVERCGNAVSAAADAFERRPVPLAHRTQ